MNIFKEFLQLFALNLVVLKRNFLEFIKVVYRYYPKLSFAKVDLTLLALYVFQNPFKISKRFLKNRGESELYLYGETPLTTLEKIAKFAEIQREDLVFELGCGRGRSCFWLKSFIQCSVVGVEYVPEFIERANFVKKYYDLEGVIFLLDDMLNVNFQNGTLFYLYGTCYDTPFIEKLIEKFKDLPKGTKIITVSYSLDQYTEDFVFEVVKKFSAEFTWGQADVYLQVVK